MFKPKMIEEEENFKCLNKHDQKIHTVVLDPKLDKKQRFLCNLCMDNIKSDVKTIGFKKIVNIIDDIIEKRKNDNDKIIVETVQKLEICITSIKEIKTFFIKLFDSLIGTTQDWTEKLLAQRQQFYQYSFYDELDYFIKGQNTNQNSNIKLINNINRTSMIKLFNILDQFNQDKDKANFSELKQKFIKVIKLTQINNSQLQNSLQQLKQIKRNEQDNYDKQLQDSHEQLEQNEQEINQLDYTQIESIKDQQETLEEFQRQKDGLILEDVELSEGVKQKQEHITQTQQLQKSKFQNSFTFSKTYKYYSCQVLQDGKLFLNQSLFFSCLCDQAIPNQGVVRFAFLIHDIGSNQTMVGIGAREIISKSGYYNLQDAGKGAYLIMSSGYCFSHHQKEKYHKPIPFTFKNDDIIIIEVDILKKYIKWLKKSTKQSFLLEIDPHYEYYPCVNGPGKVEILNDISP